jgi:hypothetical protein
LYVFPTFQKEVEMRTMKRMINVSNKQQEKRLEHLSGGNTEIKISLICSCYVNGKGQNMKGSPMNESKVEITNYKEISIHF